MAFYKSPSHAVAAQLSRGEKATFSLGAFELKIDLKPLARALGEIDIKQRNTAVQRALNDAVRKFGSWAHSMLKVWTDIRQPSRLKKGVSYRFATAGMLQASYVIRDRNIRITKAYFGASYNARPPGRPGGLARWGKPFSPAGAQWLSGGKGGVRAHTFMIPGRAPVFIHLKKFGKNNRSKGDAIMPVWGPNPAKLLQDHAGEVYAYLRTIAQSNVMGEISRQIELEVRRVKAKHGL